MTPGPDDVIKETAESHPDKNRSDKYLPGNFSRKRCMHEIIIMFFYSIEKLTNTLFHCKEEMDTLMQHLLGLVEPIMTYVIMFRCFSFESAEKNYHYF